MRRKKSVSLFCLTSALLFSIGNATGVCGADRTVPPPWQTADIGAVGTPGYAYQGPDGDLYMAGAGSDIWGTTDSFRFVYQTIRDGEISTQNEFSQDGTNAFAKTGVMIRLSTDPSSPHVILDMKPDGGIEFMTRSTQGGETRFIAGGTAAAGRVLKLVRNRGTVTGMVCGQTCSTVGTAPFVTGPALIGVAVTSHDPSKLNHAYFAADMPAVVTVPQPWFSFDVGDVGLKGSAFFDENTFWVAGAGSDIWGTADSFRFVRQCLLGSGQIGARVVSEQNTNIYAKAGVMIRDETSPATVILDLRPDGSIEFMSRPPGAGAQMAFIAGGSASFPAWLKLTRDGDQFTGFVSKDGTAWQLVGTTTIAMTSDFCVDTGLAVTSHDTSQLNQSIFDDVSVTSEVFQDRDIGAVGQPGSASYSPDGKVLTVSGAGADIWATADAFNFFYRGANGDGQIVARLTSMQDTNTFAKAGLMLRETTDPASAHVILDIRPNGSIEFMTRSATGAATSFIAGGNVTLPIWLRLARSGSVVTGYTSADGTAWATVGSTTLSISSNALMGVAVTSHDPSVLNTSSFDNIGK